MERCDGRPTHGVIGAARPWARRRHHSVALPGLFAKRRPWTQGWRPR